MPAVPTRNHVEQSGKWISKLASEITCYWHQRLYPWCCKYQDHIVYDSVLSKEPLDQDVEKDLPSIMSFIRCRIGWYPQRRDLWVFARFSSFLDSLQANMFRLIGEKQVDGWKNREIILYKSRKLIDFWIQADRNYSYTLFTLLVYLLLHLTTPINFWASTCEYSFRCP